MRVLVSDTSVLIDLERGMLLEAAFRLSFELVVPDLLFKKELQPANGQHLLNLGLCVEDLDDQGIRRAVAYRKQETALSVATCKHNRVDPQTSHVEPKLNENKGSASTHII